jgi:EAL domain-containing protein (putative c-di-GMP-specific phosphodiesterase class I)
MNGAPITDATLARTARAALDHLRRHSGIGTWLFTRTNDYEQIVIASVDPQFSIVANTVLPSSLATDRHLANVAKTIVNVQLPNGKPYGALVGLSRDLPAPMAAGTESTVQLIANMLGALAGAEGALAAGTRRAELAAAATDAHTGVATRQAWETQIVRDDERCNGNAEQAWIYVICLDETQRRASETPDELVDAAAKLLTSIVDGRHFSARTSSSQFGVLAVDLNTAEATSLETQLRQGFSASGIAAWVGVGRRLPGVGLGAALDAADASIAAARAAVSIASTKIDDQAAELIDALNQGHIRAYFQPIVDMRTGDVVAIEALARWHSESGVREPGEFLPAIERAGLNASLFRRMLDDGLAHMAGFLSTSPNLRLAVNYDFDSIPATGLTATVTELANKHGVPLSQISLELSERQSFALAPATRNELIQVAEAGVKLVLDDFGVGFASLETLTSLPIFGVKLDRRFTGQVIDGEREPMVVKAMISMAAEAGLEVIAEGVEKQSQCDRLVRLGCRLGQGYLFALPLPPESLQTVLSAPLVSAW